MLSTSKSFFRKPSAGGGGTTDPSFAYVPLLTETGSVSVAATTVADGALTPNTVTRNGGVPTGWTSPYQTDGYWSNYFNGTSDYLTYNQTFALGTNDFTLELWLYITVQVPYPSAYWLWGWRNSTDNCPGLYLSSIPGGNGNLLWFTGNLGFMSNPNNIPLNTWTHIAITRTGLGANNLKMYINGVQVAQSSNASSFTYTGTQPIGANPSGNGTLQYTNGYISNFRLVNGTAVYTGAFTPPTTPLTAIANTGLLTCQSNRFIDNSSTPKTFTITGTPSVQSGYYPFAAPTASPGAALLNGTSQYLSVPDNAAFALGATDFTAECWIYPTSLANEALIMGQWSGNLSGTGLNFALLLSSGSTGYLRLITSANGSSVLFDLSTSTTSFTISLNTWQHIAAVRNGNVFTIYVNGVSRATTTNASALFDATNSFTIGVESNSPTQYFSGYIGNLRIVKGTAVYTGAFTPPSGPLTRTGGTYPSTTNVNTSIPDANTSLLLNLADSNYTSASSGGTNNTFIDDSTNAFTITRNGTPTQGSRTPYWPNGQWSNYFSSASDVLTFAASAGFVLTGGAFTIEFWAYPTSGSNYDTIIDGGMGSGFSLTRRAGTNAIVWQANSAQIEVGTTFLLNQWSHIVANYTGTGSVNLYINGVSVSAAGAVPTNTGTIALYVGKYSAGQPFAGYVSNVRIVKGSAVYTNGSTIPVPTAPLTPVTNTQLLTCCSNRFIDANTATAAKTITITGTPSVQAFQPFSPAASYTAAAYGGSGYFPPSSSSYLSSTITALSNTFVVMECWLYNNSLDNDQGNHYLQVGSGAPSYFLSHDGSGRARFVSRNDSAGTTFDISSTTGILKLNQWQYVVGIRNATTASLYVDGVRVGTASVSISSTSATAFYASSNAGSGRYLDGYMANARIISGSLPSGYDPASTTISIPTTPLTNVAGTRVLLNMANAGIYDAAAQNNITTVSNAQVSTAQKQWLPSSIFFNGGTSALSIPSSTAFGLGTGDWTIEFWVYLNAAPPTNVTLASMLTNASGAGFAPHIYCATGGGLRYYTNSLDRIIGGVLASGTWNYVAVSKASGNTKMYINGTQTGSTYLDSNNYGAANPFAVGDYAVPLAGGTVNGYFQDVRITKGVGRTITASPTAAFPTR